MLTLSAITHSKVWIDYLNCHENSKNEFQINQVKGVALKEMHFIFLSSYGFCSHFVSCFALNIGDLYVILDGTNF